MFDTFHQVFANIPTTTRSIGAGLFVVVCVFGLFSRLRAARREPPGETCELRRLLHIVGALRAGLLALCAAGLAVGWWMNINVLVGLAMVIGLEELYETTMVMTVLRFGVRNETREALTAGLVP